MAEGGMTMSGVAGKAKDVDPVSGKKVKAKDAPIAVFLDTVYKFESAENLAKFKEAPEKYAVLSCPVSGEPVRVRDAKAKTMHGGRTWYFCCGDCKGKFEKDPAKYETYICPTCGMTSLVADEYTVSGEVDGHVVHYCCNDCKASFEKNQMGYFSLIVPEGGMRSDAMEDENTAPPAAAPADEHSGHDH